MIHNPNCDGSHCRSEGGIVKVFPLGGGGNLILCSACWAHENNYRLARGYETKNKANWPTVNWKDAETYEGAS